MRVRCVCAACALQVPTPDRSLNDAECDDEGEEDGEYDAGDAQGEFSSASDEEVSVTVSVAAGVGDAGDARGELSSAGDEEGGTGLFCAEIDLYPRKRAPCIQKTRPGNW